MNQTDFFKKLGAPLRNKRWSWGAVRSDGTAFLRIWEDQKQILNGSQHVRVASQKRKNPRHPGYMERLEHISLIRQGAPCYLIVCTARDVNASPRRIMSFNETEVFVGDSIIESNGIWWIKLGETKSVNSLRV